MLIPLFGPHMREMDTTVQTAFNNVADIAADKLAYVTARVRDLEASILGETG